MRGQSRKRQSEDKREREGEGKREMVRERELQTLSWSVTSELLSLIDSGKSCFTSSSIVEVMSL